MGLSECALSNLFLVQEATCAEDLQSRVRLFDASKNLPGIARNISIAPAETGPSSSFKMSLWTKNSCVLHQELAALGPIILSSDATGGLLNFPLVDSIKDKVLHTKVNVIPKHALVESTAIAMSDPILCRNLSPLTLAEFASTRNATDDVFHFLSSFLESVSLLSPGRSTAKPLLFKSDCCPQLEAGALKAFAVGSGAGVTRIKCGNLVLVLLLHYDKVEWDIRNGNSSVTLKDAAVKIHDIVKETTGIFLKECSAHVWRAPDSWAHRNKKPVFAGVKERVRSIFKAFSSLSSKNAKFHFVLCDLLSFWLHWRRNALRRRSCLLLHLPPRLTESKRNTIVNRFLH
jgi:hypothetical protein